MNRGQSRWRRGRWRRAASTWAPSTWTRAGRGVWQRATRGWRERGSLPASGLVDHGPQISALTIREARVAAWTDGRAAAFSVAEGIPARLSVTTLADPSELLASIELPGAQGARGIGWAADGRLWLGSQPRGLVFSWAPGEPSATLIGRPTGDAEFSFGIAAASDGRMFLGTYPDGCVVEHHPERGFRQLHRFEGAQYVRAVALDEARGLLWAASSAPHRLWKFDLTAGGGPQPVNLDPPLADCPDDLTITATGVAFSAGHLLRLVDADGTERPLLGPDQQPLATCWMGSRGLSPELAGQHWFTGRLDPAGRGQQLIGLDPGTGVLTPLGLAVSGPAIGWGRVDGRLQAVVGNYSGEAIQYDPAIGGLTGFVLPVPAAPSRLHQLCATGRADELLIGAYLNPAVVRVTPPQAPEPFAPIGQVEGFAITDGQVVVGSYPDGLVTSRDLADPSQQVQTLAQFKASHGQARPWAFAVSPDDPQVVHVATAPGPGVRGGIIARLPIDGSAAGELVRDAPEPGHCVASLARVGDRLLAGSSRYAGEGLDPTGGRARLFDLDPVTLKVRRSLPAPGRRAGAITALLAHDGLVYGMADARLFILDPTSWRVLTVRRLRARAGVRDSGTLLAHPGGQLYALCGGQLFQVDPATLTSHRVDVPGGVGRAAIDPEGTLWLLTRSDQVMSRLASWQPYSAAPEL